MDFLTHFEAAQASLMVGASAGASAPTREGSNDDSPAPNLTDSRRANIGAQLIYEAFEGYRNRFEAVTKRAQRRFERREWQGWRTDARERLDLRRQAVQDVVQKVRDLLGDRLEDKLLWVSMKAVYSNLISARADWELAETFFNSLTRRIFTTVGVDAQIEFVTTDFGAPPNVPSANVYRSYTCNRPVPDIISDILRDIPIEARCEDIVRDAALTAEKIDRRLRELGLLRLERIDMVSEVFYRGKAAYVVGRMVHKDGVVPLVLCLLHGPSGVVIDAGLLSADEATVLFSFTHSYFHVCATRPHDLVTFLQTLLPRKPRGELYIALGYHKHGKTELYRDLLHYLSHSDAPFEVAPGVKGMVMTVFTSPDYDVVFKVIKDSFDPPKNTSAREIKKRYDLVFRHDRAGRLIDAQAFEHLKIARRHFSQDLVDELGAVALNSVAIEENAVTLQYAYIERRVFPLDLYLRDAPRQLAEAAVIDYGQAIKDLAVSNIFPGDMLIKNFGVTRLGRVVFYDYDELCLLETCNFRRIPEAQTYEQEMAAEPWYYVGPDDVFPEQFLGFLGLPRDLRPVFTEHHGDLLTAEYWQGVQERLAQGDIISVLPYGAKSRLKTA